MSDSEAPQEPRRGRLQAALRHWRLPAFVMVGFLPFVPSLWHMNSFLLADNALGFVPFMIPLSALVFWLRAHSDEGPRKRDVLLDSFFAVPLVLGALWVLLAVPSQLSWYFWIYRVDLLALPLFVLAAGFVFFGYQQVIRTWPGFVLLFLVWPYLVMRMQQDLGTPFVDLTVQVARGAVDFLRLPYAQDPEFPQAFLSTHLAEAENFELVIGQVCSGTASFIGFALFGVGIVYLQVGPWRRRLQWLALGLLLAMLANLVRVVALLTLAATAGEAVTLDVIHPVLGLILFLGLLILMLAVMPLFGLRLDVRRRGARSIWEPAEGGGRALYGLYAGLVVVAVALAVLDVQAQRYSFIGIGGGAPAIDVESERATMPEVPGWVLTHEDEIAWTDLFGRQSRGDIFLYQYPEGPGIIVQTIIVDRKSTLDRYPIEQCIVFHNRTIESIEYVPLAVGITGVLVHDTFEGVPSSTLYWQLPVNVDGDLRHARIALLLDLEEPVKEVDVAALPAAGSFAAQFAVILSNRFDAEPAARSDPRAQIDLELLELASLVIDTMVSTGGPSKVAEAAEEGG